MTPTTPKSIQEMIDDKDIEWDRSLRKEAYREVQLELDKRIDAALTNEGRQALIDFHGGPKYKTKSLTEKMREAI